MFGSSFGQQPSNASSSFGFGQPAQPAQTSSLFGQPAQPAASSPFGAPAATSNQPAASPFGSLSGSSPFGGLNAQPAASIASQGQGTGVVPFSAFEENDTTKAGKVDRYETITMMPQYANSSLQELRWQDYQANRKGPANAPVAGFGFGQSQPATTQPGIFGQPSNQSSFGGGSAFGQSQPSTSGGLFGSNNNTTNTGSNLFGSNNTQSSSSPFGGASAGGLFGQNASTNTTPSGFGSTGFGTNSTPSATGFGFGAANTANSGTFGQNNNSTSGSLFGAKPAAAPSSSLFGQPASTNTGSGFGFGSNNTQTQNPFGAANTNSGAGTGTSLFGQQANSGSAFGQSAGSGTGSGFFGSNNNTGNTGSGLFGQNNSQQTGAFGQPNNFQAGTSAFGQNNNANKGFFGQNSNSNSNTQGGGLFGQSTNNSNSGGLFGQNNTASSSPFGQPQNQSGLGLGSALNKPTGGLFGQQSGNTAFGQNNNGGSSFDKPGGLFGQNSTQNNQSGFGLNSSQNNNSAGNSTGGLFGQQQKPAFGFGQPNNNNTQTGGSSLFGTSAPKPTGGLFGQNPGSGTASGGGLFGANNNNNNSTGTNAGSLFGGTSSSTNAQAPGFGSLGNNAANTGTSTGGLFGKPSGGGGLFGNNAAPSSSSGSGGLFGNTSGNANNGAPGFGLNNQTNTSGGLFSTNKPAAPSGGLFGGASTGLNSSGLGNSFGASLGGQQPQTGSTPVASIDSNAYLSNPLFSSVQQQPNSALQSGEPAAVPKNKSASFKLPTGTLLAQVMQPRPLPKGTRISSQVQDLEKKSENGTDGLSELNNFSKPSISQKEDASEKFRNVLYSKTTDDIILDTEAFDFARHGMRLITSNSKEAPQAVSVSTPSRLLKESKAREESTGSPDLSQIEAAHSLASVNDDDDAQIENTSLDTSLPQNSSDTPDNELVDSHGYWISPARHKLVNMTMKELRKVKDFRVGQRTQGFVEFMEPVDLSNFSNVQAQVCGHIVAFGERSFCLYPVESERPPIGQGFNVKHRVTLYGVFARARDTREPVRDPEHPIAKKFAKRLQSQGKFVSWSAQTGTWSFEVDPASK